jgi:hypothetical protein
MIPVKGNPDNNGNWTAIEIKGNNIKISKHDIFNNKTKTVELSKNEINNYLNQSPPIIIKDYSCIKNNFTDLILDVQEINKIKNIIS